MAKKFDFKHIVKKAENKRYGEARFPVFVNHLSPLRNENWTKREEEKDCEQAGKKIKAFGVILREERKSVDDY